MTTSNHSKLKSILEEGNRRNNPTKVSAPVKTFNVEPDEQLDDPSTDEPMTEDNGWVLPLSAAIWIGTIILAILLFR